MKVTINEKGVRRWLQGHAWVFRSDLKSLEAERAGPATVFSESGKILGEALYSPKSLIALRRMTQGREKITAGLIRERIEQADRHRQVRFKGEKAYRVVFGEADFLPSLIVDRFGDLICFQTLSAGMETFKENIIQYLRERFAPRSIVERNDASVRQFEELPLLRQTVYGEAPAEAAFQFSGKHFSFQPLEGQKTGFFLDQRCNAAAAARYAFGEMLDVFSYVGQFGIHAAAKAEKVLCVDASAAALAQAERNAELNELRNVETHEANAFDFLKECDRQGRAFDVISLDPPAFVKSRAALKAALRGYKEINLRAIRLLRPSGILITSSCSQHLSPALFEATLSAAARDAKREVQILEKRGQAPDHPILLSMPETEYLKCYILRVL